MGLVSKRISLLAFSALLVLATNVNIVNANIDNCSETSIVFLRGSGQNSTPIITLQRQGGAKVYSNEVQTIKFFDEVGSRISGTKEFVSLHNFDSKYNNYGYAAVDILELKNKPTHRTDVINRYYESVMDGKEELTGYLKQKMSDCPYQKIILGGYSQGAHVLGEALWDLNPIERGRITFAALYADPKYNPHTGGLTLSQAPWVRGNSGRFNYGILGPRKFYLPADVMYKASWCDASDPICTNANFKGPVYNALNLIAEKFVDKTHSNKYQELDSWIEQSANEIAIRVTNDSNRLNQTLGANWIKEGTTKQLDIALVIDSSGTMGYEVERLKLSARYFIEKLYGQSWDTKVAVVSYSDNDYQKDVWMSYWLAKVNQDFTKDQNKVYNAIHAVLPYGMANNNSAMYSGMMKAMNELSWRNGAQKKIITITNNAARESDPGGYRAEDVIRKALELDPVAISSVDTPNGYVRPATSSLQNLATKTNGTVITSSFSDTALISNQVDIINLAPVAIIDGPAASSTTDGLELSAAYSYDPDSYITGYNWDCNDDGIWDYTEVQPNVVCQYSSPYSGLVVLEVSSADSQSAKAIQEVNITSSTVNNVAIPDAPQASAINRSESSVSINISNEYSENTLIKISDINGNVYNYFKPSDGYVLDYVNSSAFDVFLSAVNEAGFSEEYKLSIAEYIAPVVTLEPNVNPPPQDTANPNDIPPQEEPITVEPTPPNNTPPIDNSPPSNNIVIDPPLPPTEVVVPPVEEPPANEPTPKPTPQETPKVLPVSESNPDWLLAAEKAFYTQLVNAATQTSNITQTTTSGLSRQNMVSYYAPAEANEANVAAQVATATPSTQVAGLSSEVKQKFSYNKAATSRLKPSLIILYLGAGLLLLGLLAVLIKLNIKIKI